ncbi:NGG1p interacting factor NIF3 [Legionella taurinensis]|uniref:NGG1p interacting factor NIF3 n=1 Tax=Legionella taurinensis TaxID=70611 RepID=A0AB38N2B3_9GAMM|nr:NGG1p interacting factor NIF3 [Legionella taurinensis]MDX1838209.1 NGG1p interacting factor NIF3 [Legionella taurinensis]PUT39297.1 NGG1p interacting factor NIF3 [Legionella taurinensis]PUT40643.1 NGG1p interacting factor NIF3 [Legionella taurinensis]PUT44063.1 NGG1p interacting factor NIF3 [Legionella taurinensis]PUT46325.1 NGG1p interacting factor NIF3 [Legionella taurinensis]
MPEFKLSFYVPESHLQEVKQALFNAGAGKLGNYDQTCWQTLGQGQFRPLQGANPTLGERLELTYVTEVKVEMLCEEGRLPDAIRALKQAHPYEEPAYDIVRLEQVK